tara:strand:+ start:483 stop:725 length:243 start_codon:yes stop_codon:yes gene_type:complete
MSRLTRELAIQYIEDRKLNDADDFLHAPNGTTVGYKIQILDVKEQDNHLLFLVKYTGISKPLWTRSYPRLEADLKRGVYL